MYNNSFFDEEDLSRILLVVSNVVEENDGQSWWNRDRPEIIHSRGIHIFPGNETSTKDHLGVQDHHVKICCGRNLPATVEERISSRTK